MTASEPPGTDGSTAETDGSTERADGSAGVERDSVERDPLELARAIARGLAGKTPARRRRTNPEGRGSDRRARGDDPQFTGAREDPRDPQTLDKALGELVSAGGWSDELRVHGVFARWGAIVGAEIAAHATPVALADGRLEVRTDTTAWATQLRLLAPELLKRLNGALGDGTVLVIDVKGPNAPSWSKGRLRVKGRGPRDTYG